ncbi:unnamed protein product [Linum trigynum]|uniref:Uncharacterized protein n=1 Tax=Linum trigynum TaxID=586398 RepID=A0AAV2CJH2_9ROSI
MMRDRCETLEPPKWPKLKRKEERATLEQEGGRGQNPGPEAEIPTQGFKLGLFPGIRSIFLAWGSGI